MSPAEILDAELAETAQELRSRQEPFAFATVVRTAGSTSAKPGAKALLGADGTILHGWLGGGCICGAVKRAALEALQGGAPQLVSVTPEDVLKEKGVIAGDTVDGTRFARNGCPSRGTVDIFIEPCMPAPELVILGRSPVALALRTLAPLFHWSVSTSLAPEESASCHRYVVIATQGQGDLAALKSALIHSPAYTAFVGSARKFAAMARKLHDDGLDEALTKSVDVPAGLDLGAVTPEEIALSILAQLLRVRRKVLVNENV
jgi:xanthine dehydrogenase accessory factor